MTKVKLTDCETIRFNNTELSKVKLNGTEVWAKPTILAPTVTYEISGSNLLYKVHNPNNGQVVLYGSTDNGSTWTQITTVNGATTYNVSEVLSTGGTKSRYFKFINDTDFSATVLASTRVTQLIGRAMSYISSVSVSKSYCITDNNETVTAIATVASDGAFSRWSVSSNLTKTSSTDATVTITTNALRADTGYIYAYGTSSCTSCTASSASLPPPLICNNIIQMSSCTGGMGYEPFSEGNTPQIESILGDDLFDTGDEEI